MKKKILSALAAAFAAGGAYCAQVSPEAALAAADAWCARSAGGLGETGSATSVRAETLSDGSVLWYEVSTSKGGTIIVSPDDRIEEPIVAVLPGTSFPEGIPAAHPLRTMLTADMKNRLAAFAKPVPMTRSGLLYSAAPVTSPVPVLSATSTTTSSSSGASAKWTALAGSKLASAVPSRTLYYSAPAYPAAASTLSDPVVTVSISGEAPSTGPTHVFSHLPGFSNGFYTHWDQDAKADGTGVYNRYTPAGYVCGCVAVAGAAVLQYAGVEKGPVAVTNECGFNTFKTNLVTMGGPYDWSILPAAMGGTARNPVRALTDPQRDLLSRVVYDMGVLVGMDYGANGTASGATIGALYDALKDHYGFTNATLHAFTGKEDLDPGLYDRTIYADLRAGMPVALSIAGSSGGHAVVATGYAEDFLATQYVRVFMGWGGSGDGWYTLPKVADYDTTVCAITGLVRDGRPLPVVGRATVPLLSAAQSDQTDDGRAGAAFVPVEIEYTLEGETTVITNYTSNHGVFAVRLPAGATGKVKVGGVERIFPDPQIEIMDPPEAGLGEGGEAGMGEGGEEEEGPSEIELAYDQLPPVMDFELEEGAAPVAYVTPSAALDAAKMKIVGEFPYGRPVLLVSGRQGDPATDAMLALLSERAGDITNKFCLYYADADADNYGYRAPSPSMAVYNSAVFRTEGGWAYFNGCLGGINLAEVLGPDTEPHVPTGAEIDELLDNALRSWEAVNKAAFSFSVKSVSRAVVPEEQRTLPFKYSRPADCIESLRWESAAAPRAGETDFADLRNGETFVSSVPQFWTNATEGIVHECVGWQLVDADAKEESVWGKKFGWEETPAASGGGGVSMVIVEEVKEPYASGSKVVDGRITAKIAAGSVLDEESNPVQNLKLVWLWKDVKYRQTAEAVAAGSAAYVGSVVPAEIWMAPGETNTVLAVETVASDGYKATFCGWCQTAGTGFDLNYGGADDVSVRGTLAYPVCMPRHVKAQFRKDGMAAADEYPFVSATVVAKPADLMAEEAIPAPQVNGQEVAWNTAAEEILRAGMRGMVTAPESFTDATGAVWRCTGWTMGEANGGGRSVVVEPESAEEAVAVTFLWEPVPVEPEIIELNIAWSAGLDNLQAGQNVIVPADELPANFEIEQYSVADLQGVPDGWKAEGLKIDSGGNLVAVLAMDEERLAPKGEADSSPIAITLGADGTVNVDCSVSNAAKGFWYVILESESLAGPWTAAASGQAAESGALEGVGLSVPAPEASKFYRLSVTDKNPLESP